MRVAMYWQAIGCADALPGALASYRMHQYVSRRTGKLADALVRCLVQWLAIYALISCVIKLVSDASISFTMHWQAIGCTDTLLGALISYRMHRCVLQKIGKLVPDASIRVAMH